MHLLTVGSAWRPILFKIGTTGFCLALGEDWAVEISMHLLTVGSTWRPILFKIGTTGFCLALGEDWAVEISMHLLTVGSTWRPILFKIGTTGFEPATPTTPRWCATKLRYVPILLNFQLSSLVAGTV